MGKNITKSKANQKPAENKPKRKMTVTEKNKDWLELCHWIEKELLGYDENQTMHAGACNKIRGLFTGQLFANNNREIYGHYNCAVILNTFKIYKTYILNALKGKTFTSEVNKVAYICAIVRNHINDVYMKMKHAQESQEKAEKLIDSSAMYNQQADYKKQTESNQLQNNIFEEIW